MHLFTGGSPFLRQLMDSHSCALALLTQPHTTRFWDMDSHSNPAVCDVNHTRRLVSDVHVSRRLVNLACQGCDREDKKLAPISTRKSTPAALKALLTAQVGSLMSLSTSLKRHCSEDPRTLQAGDQVSQTIYEREENRNKQRQQPQINNVKRDNIAKKLEINKPTMK